MFHSTALRLILAIATLASTLTIGSASRTHGIPPETATARLSELRSLYVRGANDACRLVIANRRLSSEDFRALIESPRIESVEIDDDQFDDNCFRHFRGRSDLIRISVRSQSINDNGPSLMGTVNALSVSLEGPKLSKETCNYLAGLPNVDDISICSQGLKAEDVSLFKGCKKLKMLDLGDSPVGNDVVPHIASLKGLSIVGLRNTRLSGKSLAGLGALDVNTLFLDMNPELSSGINGLDLGKWNVKDVSMIGCGVTDEHLDKMAGCKNIKRLRIDDSKVTKVGIERFRKNRPDVSLIVN